MILEANDLSKTFGTTVALNGVSCEVPEGATGLLGPNGAGKTTFLRILLGLLPAGGSARVLGLDPMRKPREVRARIGYMPESECIVPGLHALHVVAFMGRLAGMPRRPSFKRAHEVMYFVGLGEERYRDATEYSLGMQQRLKLATALVHDPALLFLDEPTNGLDPKGRTEMLALIGELATEHGKNVILSSHLLKDVEQVCGRVLVFNHGRLVHRADLNEEEPEADRGRVFEVVSRGDRAPLHEALAAAGATIEREEPLRVRIPTDAGPDLLFRAARDACVQIRGLRPMRRTLEDVFLDAVEEPRAG